MQLFKNLFEFILILNCVTVFLLDNIQGEKTDRTSLLSYKIYQPITGVLPCFRRMNGTHQIGCSTSSSGDVGVLHLIDHDPANATVEAEGLDWVINSGPHAPYIVLLYVPSFRRDILIKLNNPDRVSGILVLQRNESRTSVPHYSPDSQCPNVGYGLYNKSSSHFQEHWNYPGSSLLFEDWAFAIIYIEGDGQAELLLECYETFNKPNPDNSARDWSLCAGQLKAHMMAAVDSPTCVRRNEISMSVWSLNPKSICDPVGGYNIWSPLVSRSQEKPYEPSPHGSVIVIATRLDSSSMFDKFAPGADSSATGLTAILALVKLLQPLKEYLHTSEIQNIYFIIFNGEAFDYVGSSRVVYDMNLDKFPMDKKENSSSHPALLRLNDIKYFIELDQLASYSDSSSEYFVHRNWDAPGFRPGSKSAVEKLVNTLQKQSKNLNIKSVPNGADWKGLPPASLQSFFTKDPDLPGIVITNHNGVSFLNKFYNSILDDRVNIGYSANDTTHGRTVNAISDLVATIARTVEELINPGIPGSLYSSSDPGLIDELLHCYVETARCPLFQTLRKEYGQVSNKPFPLYAGVYGKYQKLTSASDVTAKVMTFYQGEVINKSEEDCKHDNEQPIFNYFYLNDSCYKTLVGYTAAKSPAFDIEDYDWASGQYSTWTESSWNTFTVKIFLKPSLSHDLFVFFLGLIIFILSSIVIYWVNRKSDVIFEPRREQIC